MLSTQTHTYAISSLKPSSQVCLRLKSRLRAVGFGNLVVCRLFVCFIFHANLLCRRHLFPKHPWFRLKGLMQVLFWEAARCRLLRRLENFFSFLSSSMAIFSSDEEFHSPKNNINSPEVWVSFCFCFQVQLVTGWHCADIKHGFSFSEGALS